MAYSTGFFNNLVGDNNTSGFIDNRLSGARIKNSSFNNDSYAGIRTEGNSYSHLGSNTTTSGNGTELIVDSNSLSEVD